MRNKNVGYLIVGLSVIIGLIIWLFNSGMTSIVSQSCSHGPSCTMYGTIKTQTYLSFSLALVVLLIGIFFIFSKEERDIVVKKIREQVEVKRKPIDHSKLDKEEKPIIILLEEAQGTMFQSDLVEKTGFSKVKVTRILDRLEGKQLIERKRRGMTNIVILK